MLRDESLNSHRAFLEGKAARCVVEVFARKGVELFRRPAARVLVQETKNHSKRS
jgi:hypothetical protein